MTVVPIEGAARLPARELAEATEAQIAQVVALIDQLPDRGDADALVAPLRPRLARLRPPRPPRFERLLFTPLDSVIVSPVDWRRGAPSVPRSALLSLAALVRAGLGKPTAMTGAQLWPAAAALLQDAAVPADWRARTGLADTDFLPVVTSIALVLNEAVWLTAATLVPDPQETALRLAPRLDACLHRDASGEAAVACLFVVMADRLGAAQAHLDAIEAAVPRSTRPAVRSARTKALHTLLTRIQSPVPLDGDLARAARRVARDTSLLNQVPPAVARETGIEVETARRTLDASCRSRFAAAVEAALAIPPSVQGRLDDAAIRALETEARSLALFAKAARRIGSADHYDRALAEAARRLPKTDHLSAADRLRLLEILLGPSVAQNWAA